MDIKISKSNILFRSPFVLKEDKTIVFILRRCRGGGFGGAVLLFLGCCPTRKQKQKISRGIIGRVARLEREKGKLVGVL